MTTHLDARPTSTATNRSKTIAASPQCPTTGLSMPFSGSLATATSLSWALTQALFVVALVAYTRSGAVGASRSGRIGGWMAVAGSIVFVAAHAASLTVRDARLDDPADRAAIALFVLAVGVCVLCMLPLPFTPLLPLSVAVYATTTAAFAVALLAHPEARKQ